LERDKMQKLLVEMVDRAGAEHSVELEELQHLDKVQLVEDLHKTLFAVAEEEAEHLHLGRLEQQVLAEMVELVQIHIQLMQVQHQLALAVITRAGAGAEMELSELRPQMEEQVGRGAEAIHH
jgi:hypothetical protein